MARQFLETERLILRDWTEKDFTPFAAMNASPVVMEFFPSVLTADETRSMMDRLQKEIDERGYGLWVAELKDTGAFTGFIGLHEATFVSDFTPCVEIGWRLLPAYWGRGLATEGARACLDFGFSSGLKEIYSFTSIHNTRSERVMKRIGMVKIGEFDHPRVAEGNWLRRHVLYNLKVADY
ncbi:MAG: GNAT family N-acetyltransferase [Bacteroidetes bacterium]|nr:GNAT family N-acetyltransferase [Bacteroidota bacterium]